MDHGKDVVSVDVDGVHTNIVVMEVVNPRLNAETFCNRLAQVRWFMVYWGLTPQQQPEVRIQPTDYGIKYIKLSNIECILPSGFGVFF